MILLLNRLLIVFVCLFVTTQTHAADFSVKGNEIGVVISGQIVKGDYTKLKDFLTETTLTQVQQHVPWPHLHAFRNVVYLNSPGGDVAEAMKIANLLNKNFVSVLVDDGGICFSSCIILWAGGVERTLGISGKLGVHRLSLDRKEISVIKTKKAVSSASKRIEEFLTQMGIPRKIIDKMNETSPADLFIIDNNWLIQEDLFVAMDHQPSFIEVVEKECGPSSMVAFKNTHQIQSHEVTMQWMRCKDDVRDKNRELNSRELFDLVFGGE